jgi:DNA repair and recombination protein RAD54B
LPPKTEYVLFCKPTKPQAKIYRHVVTSPMFHTALRSQETAFQLITILKKLCNSPSLMNPDGGNDDATPSSSLVALNEMLPEGISKYYQNFASSKIRLLDRLLRHLRQTTDEKVVVISNYTSTLNMIEALANNSNLKTLRLDGSVPAKKRQALVDEFNGSTPEKAFIFLLSAKAGGVGLNLIGASRLILFDVDWNPATDDQAIARIHRQGQKRHCKIYRFLIKGGLEERIWQRQVVKRALADSILQGGTGATSSSTEAGKSSKAKSNTTAFSQEELKDLFRLDESDGLRTHELIECPCDGAGHDGTGESKAGLSVEKPVNDKGEGVDEDDENEIIASSPRSERRSSDQKKQSWTPAKDVSKGSALSSTSDLEAEKHELMQYRHINTSLLYQPGGEDGRDGDLKATILSAVDDECLEHVLSLERDVVGGGGVSYVFKKTTG